MVTNTEKLQFQAWAIQEGFQKLSSRDQELIELLFDTFGLRVLNFCLEERVSSSGRAQNLVHLVLHPLDRVAGDLDREAKVKIDQRFAEHCGVSDVIATYRPFKKPGDEISKELWEEEKVLSLQGYGSVWTMSQAVIFYYTDAQITENKENGTSDRIVEALTILSNKFRRTESVYQFDSKESFERDYEGKWHYYWK